MAFVIAEPCIGVRDGSCTDVCPVDCIHSDDTQPQFFIDPTACIDCGACATMCPVGAIFYAADVPAQWNASATRNADYYRSSGDEAEGRTGALSAVPSREPLRNAVGRGARSRGKPWWGRGCNGTE